MPFRVNCIANFRIQSNEVWTNSNMTPSLISCLISFASLALSLNAGWQINAPGAVQSRVGLELQYNSVYCRFVINTFKNSITFLRDKIKEDNFSIEFIKNHLTFHIICNQHQSSCKIVLQNERKSFFILIRNKFYLLLPNYCAILQCNIFHL